MSTGEATDNYYTSKQFESNSSAYIDVQAMKDISKTKSADDLLLPTYDQSWQDQHKSVQLSYSKLKISFVCMLILNTLLLVVVIICMMFIVPSLSKMEELNHQSQDKDVLKDTTQMKCLSIKKKLNKLYKNGQMVENVNENDKCSMEDLIDSFKQNIEESIQKEIKSAAFHLVSNNTDSHRCTDSRTLYCLQNWKVSIKTTDIEVNDESIVVPSSGAYFLYSKVVINAKLDNKMREEDMVTHSIRYSDTGHKFSDLETSSLKCGIVKNTMSHISYIEKIQYLVKGSVVKVAIDLPNDMTFQSSVSGGSFGMFKL